MENITIGQIVCGITTIGVIAGFIFGILKWYKSTFEDKFNKIEKRLEKVEKATEEQAKEIEESKEERLILLKAQLACLKGLKEQGCNGPVTKAIADIEEYLVDKAHDKKIL